MPERRRRTTNAKMAKMTTHPTVAILATLTTFPLADSVFV
jgi:hypothetical protein